MGSVIFNVPLHKSLYPKIAFNLSAFRSSSLICSAFRSLSSLCSSSFPPASAAAAAAASGAAGRPRRRRRLIRIQMRARRSNARAQRHARTRRRPCQETCAPRRNKRARAWRCTCILKQAHALAYPAGGGGGGRRAQAKWANARTQNTHARRNARAKKEEVHTHMGAPSCRHAPGSTCGCMPGGEGVGRRMQAKRGACMHTLRACQGDARAIEPCGPEPVTSNSNSSSSSSSSSSSGAGRKQQVVAVAAVPAGAAAVASSAGRKPWLAVRAHFACLHAHAGACGPTLA